MQKLAVIDCGTNTFHMLVVSVNNAPVEVVFRSQIAVKLGEGGINQHKIHHKAFERGLAALKQFSQDLKRLEVDKVSAFGTSAIRSADNGQEFIDRVREETGIVLQMASGAREAELIYKGVSHSYPLADENVLVMDIGGGSVEFTIGNKEGLNWFGSFEIGAARLVELFHTSEPISPEEVQQLNAYLDIELKPLKEALQQLPISKLVGSAGSFDSICELINAEYGRHLLKNGEIYCEIDIEEYKGIHAKLLKSTLEDRINMPGLVDYRVEMMVVASCLIYYVLTSYSLSQLFCSTYSLKEGALFEMMEGE